MTETTLACPHCGSTEFRSWETTKIGYPCRMVRSDDGVVEIDYPGNETYDVDDESPSYEDDLWCRGCGDQVPESALVVPATED